MPPPPPPTTALGSERPRRRPFHDGCHLWSFGLYLFFLCGSLLSTGTRAGLRAALVSLERRASLCPGLPLALSQFNHDEGPIFHWWFVALSEDIALISNLMFTSRKRQTARGASGRSLHRTARLFARPMASTPSVPFIFCSYLPGLPVGGAYLATLWRLSYDRATLHSCPLSRQRRMSTLAPCASARAARQHAERGEPFLSPTHPQPTQGSCSGVSSADPLPTLLALD